MLKTIGLSGGVHGQAAAANSNAITYKPDPQQTKKPDPPGSFDGNEENRMRIESRHSFNDPNPLRAQELPLEQEYRQNDGTPPEVREDAKISSTGPASVPSGEDGEDEYS